MSCRSAAVFREPVDTGNVFLWFVKFREYVLTRSGAVEAEVTDDIRHQQGAFVACLRAASVDVVWHNGHIVFSTGQSNQKRIPAPRALVDDFISAFKRVDVDMRAKIIGQLDLLLSRCLTQLRHGDYYTPPVWVAQAHQLAMAHIDLEWEQNCIVWDCCCGTGNLTADIPFEKLVQTTLFDTDVGVVEARGTNAARKHLGTFDFLSNVRGVPDQVDTLLKDHPDAPIVFYNNPPFKTAANFESSTSKPSTKNVAKTEVATAMRTHKPPFRTDNLYLHFLYKMTILAGQWARISKERKIFNLVFLPTNAWAGSQDHVFLQWYFHQWAFLGGFVFPASEFAGVQGKSWSVCCTLWQFGSFTIKMPFTIPLAMMTCSNGQPIVVGETIATSSTPKAVLNCWLKEFNASTTSTRLALPLSNAMQIAPGNGKTTLHTDAIGYFVNSTNGIKQNMDQVYLLSSVRRAGHGCDVLRMPSCTLDNNPLTQFRHLLRVSAVFFVRRAILPRSTEMWKVWQYDYLYPNVTENNTDFQRWAVGCMVYSLFDSQRSLQSSMRNMSWNGKHFPHVPNEWFPFTPDDVRGWATRVQWADMQDDLDRYGQSPRFVGQLVQQAAQLFSEETTEMLRVARLVFDESIQKRKERASDDLPQLQLACWDAGWYQLKAVLTEDQQKIIKDAHRRLRAYLLPGIWKYGFLSKLPPLHDDSKDDTSADFRWWEHVASDETNDTNDTNIFPVSIRSVAIDEDDGDIRMAIDNSLQDELVQQHRVRLDARLAERNLVLERVDGDGNCQFAAIARRLNNVSRTATPLTHRQVRHRVVAWMRDHGETFRISDDTTMKDFTTDNWNTYCDTMARPGEWGNQLTLVAAAENFRVNIRLVTSAKEFPEYTISATSPPMAQITLAFWSEWHYDAVTASVQQAGGTPSRRGKRSNATPSPGAKKRPPDEPKTGQSKTSTIE